MLLEEKCARLLLQKKKTLAIAESCTGGLLTHRLTNIPGSSNFLKVGLVVYSNESKIKILKISPHSIKTHGAVSSNVALKMAEKARIFFSTDFGISITGIAGPSGGSKRKPKGLTFIAIATPLERLCLRCQFAGTRIKIKLQAVNQALQLLKLFLD